MYSSINEGTSTSSLHVWQFEDDELMLQVPFVWIVLEGNRDSAKRECFKIEVCIIPYLFSQF